MSFSWCELQGGPEGRGLLGRFDSLWDKGMREVWVASIEFKPSVPPLGTYTHSTGQEAPG